MPLLYRQVRGVGFGTVVQGAEPSVAEPGCRGVVTAAVDTHGAAPDPRPRGNTALTGSPTPEWRDTR